MNRQSQLVSLVSALGFLLLGACGSGHPCPTANACTERSATQCVGDEVQTCQSDANCCLQWSAATACSGGQSCAAGACPGSNACAGKECGYADSCGVACESGSTCTFLGCAGNLGTCNQACSDQCINATTTAACLTPCQQNCTSIHGTCCAGYIAQYPKDICQ